MKLSFAIAIVCFFYCISTHAQQVWTEGTVWDTYADQHHVVHTLGSPVIIEGIEYLPYITEYDNEEPKTEAYVRSERGDSLVFIRSNANGHLSDKECLLYDFTKSFEYGDTIRYGLYSLEGGYVMEEIIDEEKNELIYYQDILEEGDALPCWMGLLYKIGYMGGPLTLFMSTQNNSSEGGTRPNASNLSHMVFSTKGGHKFEYFPSSIELILVDDALNKDNVYYAANGRKLQEKPVRGIYIHRGKKYIIIY